MEKQLNLVKLRSVSFTLLRHKRSRAAEGDTEEETPLAAAAAAAADDDDDDDDEEDDDDNC